MKYKAQKVTSTSRADYHARRWKVTKIQRALILGGHKTEMAKFVAESLVPDAGPQGDATCDAKRLQISPSSDAFDCTFPATWSAGDTVREIESFLFCTGQRGASDSR